MISWSSMVVGVACHTSFVALVSFIAKQRGASTHPVPGFVQWRTSRLGSKSSKPGTSRSISTASCESSKLTFRSVSCVCAASSLYVIPLRKAFFTSRAAIGHFFWAPTETTMRCDVLEAVAANVIRFPESRSLNPLRVIRALMSLIIFDSSSLDLRYFHLHTHRTSKILVAPFLGLREKHSCSFHIVSSSRIAAFTSLA